MEGIEHKIVKVNGTNMHVGRTRGRPFIPELRYSWRHQIIALSSLGYRAVAPDMRGSGDTDAPDSITSYTHGPDKVKAVLNLSVPFVPFSSQLKPLDLWRASYRHKGGVIEGEFAEIGTEREFLTYRVPGPIYLTKGKLFGHSADTPVTLPSWLSEEEELSGPWVGCEIKVPAKYIEGDQDLVYHMPGVKQCIEKGGFKKNVPLLKEVVVIGVGLHQHRKGR
ncbi:hypothetical protein PTKIN_Ptkin03bG0089800 [Pterospermum kingtungense]